MPIICIYIYRLQKLKLVLWDDLAQNEGEIIEELVRNSEKKPIVSLSNVHCSIYKGNFISKF